LGKAFRALALLPRGGGYLTQKPSVLGVRAITTEVCFAFFVLNDNAATSATGSAIGEGCFHGVGLSHGGQENAKPSVEIVKGRTHEEQTFNGGFAFELG
jgi:hypothetical protein